MKFEKFIEKFIEKKKSKIKSLNIYIYSNS